jgi:hypothetical protein
LVDSFESYWHTTLSLWFANYISAFSTTSAKSAKSANSAVSAENAEQR